MISKSLLGLATDSPCGVWDVDEPLASPMMVHLSIYVSEW